MTEVTHRVSGPGRPEPSAYPVSLLWMVPALSLVYAVFIIIMSN